MDITETTIEIIDRSLGFISMGGKGSGHYRHGGRKGKRGGSAPSKGAAPIAWDTTNDEKEAILRTLDASGIPTSHLHGIKFTTNAPPGATKTSEGDFYYKSTDRVYTGMREGNTMHLSQEAVWDSPSTIVHEIGHYVTRKISSSAYHPQNLALTRSAKAIKAMSSDKRQKLGLRGYSGSNAREIMADIYMVKYFGSSAQWSSLERWVKSEGLDFLLKEIS